MSWLQTLVFKTTIEPRLRRLKKLLPDCSIHPAGSRYVCDPPVLTTDVDFLVYHTNQSIAERLTMAGFVMSDFTSYRTNLKITNFSAWRKGKLNLIVTNNLNYAETFQTATYLCKLHNVTNKNDRVYIHEMLRGEEQFDHNTVHWAFNSNGADGVRDALELIRRPYAATLQKAYRIKNGIKL